MHGWLKSSHGVVFSSARHHHTLLCLLMLPRAWRDAAALCVVLGGRRMMATAWPPPLPIFSDSPSHSCPRLTPSSFSSYPHIQARSRQHQQLQARARIQQKEPVVRWGV